MSTAVQRTHYMHHFAAFILVLLYNLYCIGASTKLCMKHTRIRLRSWSLQAGTKNSHTVGPHTNTVYHHQEFFNTEILGCKIFELLNAVAHITNFCANTYFTKIFIGTTVCDFPWQTIHRLREATFRLDSKPKPFQATVHNGHKIVGITKITNNILRDVLTSTIHRHP